VKPVCLRVDALQNALSCRFDSESKSDKQECEFCVGEIQKSNLACALCGQQCSNWPPACQLVLLGASSARMQKSRAAGASFGRATLSTLVCMCVHAGKPATQLRFMPSLGYAEQQQDSPYYHVCPEMLNFKANCFCLSKNQKHIHCDSKFGQTNHS